MPRTFFPQLVSHLRICYLGDRGGKGLPFKPGWPELVMQARLDSDSSPLAPATPMLDYRHVLRGPVATSIFSITALSGALDQSYNLQENLHGFSWLEKRTTFNWGS